MIENKEFRSKSPKSQLRHSYTLADGQRIPVLFRMKNIQSAAAASVRTGGMQEQISQQQVVTAPAPQPIEGPATEPMIRQESTIAGPSWLRRNAYRFTVVTLLAVTLIVLNNNRGQQVASNGSKDELELEAPVVELATTQSVPASEIAVPQSVTPSVAIETPKLPAPEQPKIEPSVEAPVLAQPNAVAAANGPTVEVSESDSARLYLISKPATNSDNTLAPQEANKSDLATSQSNDLLAPSAETTLLAPQTLGLNNSTAPAMASNQSPSVGFPNDIPATSVSNIGNQYPETQTSTVVSQANRYATAPNNGSWQTPSTGPQSTNEPNLDPSVLYAIKQNFQVQSSEQAVRDMRQQAQLQAPAPQVPQAATAADSIPWKAIPTSGSLPPNAFAPNYNVAQPNTNQPQAAASHLPQQGAPPQTTPKRTPYIPLSPELSQPSDPSLYPATTPDGTTVNSATNVPRTPGGYTPISDQPNWQSGMNYGAPSGTNNPYLYESADQSFGMGN